MQIIGNAEIFAKLHFNRNTVFDKIHLIVGTIRFQAFAFNNALLFFLV